eukprot:TRINITY_DN81016_c0_g1_i1.p1 TRINITY_DN81016_c0_g1~~TRINITY_DN81016_c0_g1_i1.p1  ORF type:complete len:606 (-),score=134.76 TRINITY_DN81016_c0_g1_i1:152-1969(-)
MSAEARLAQDSQRLLELKSSLGDEELQVFDALEKCMQRYKANYSQVAGGSLEKGLKESLEASATLRGQREAPQIFRVAQNQWKVHLAGKEIFCSVRLEISEQQLAADVKHYARIVKDLLHDSGWKKESIECVENAVSLPRQMQKEAKRRYLQGPQWHGNGYRSSEGSEVCKICNRPMEEDQLHGEHMCVVQANWQCSSCEGKWSSHHCRLQPGGQRVMGQLCLRCGSAGIAIKWQVEPARHMPSQGQGRGMHQSSLCEACQQFGNCVGIFFDPQIATLALGLALDSTVTWDSYSEELPAVLVARMAQAPTAAAKVWMQPYVKAARSGHAAPTTGHRSMAIAAGGVKNQELFNAYLNYSMTQSEASATSRASSVSEARLFERAELLQHAYEHALNSVDQDREPVDELQGEQVEFWIRSSRFGSECPDECNAILQKLRNAAPDRGTFHRHCFAVQQFLQDHEENSTLHTAPKQRLRTNLRRRLAGSVGSGARSSDAFADGEDSDVSVASVRSNGPDGQSRPLGDPGLVQELERATDAMTPVETPARQPESCRSETPLLSKLQPFRKQQLLNAAREAEPERPEVLAEERLRELNNDVIKAMQSFRAGR